MAPAGDSTPVSAIDSSGAPAVDGLGIVPNPSGQSSTLFPGLPNPVGIGGFSDKNPVASRRAVCVPATDDLQFAVAQR